MRITKVYTRTGDRGGTRLVGGAVAEKDDPRIEAYGTVDELNAILGIVRTYCRPTDAEATAEKSDEKVANAARLDDMCKRVQNDLFNVGADLATPADSRWEGMRRVGDVEVERMEAWIDALNADLPPLKEFILPGGGPVGAFLHQARTVCRRAERRVVTLIRLDPETGEGVLRYLNRLSDWLFVASRWSARSLGEPEFLWDRTL